MKAERKYLLFIIALHAVFFIFSLTIGNIQLPDSIDYIWQAKNFETNGSFYAFDTSQPIKIDYYSKRPPLYALFIWATTSIIPSLYIVTVLQNLLSILSAWLVYKLLKTEYKIKNPAFWCCLLYLFFPNQLLYANMVMSETLLQFLITAAFYCFVKFYKNPNKTSYLFINNAALAMALLTKPIMLYFWLINFVVVLIIGIKNKKYTAPFSVLLIPAVVLLWMEVNYTKTGYRHYSSISHINLKDYNTKYFLFSKYGSKYGDSVIDVIDNKAINYKSYALKSEFIKDTCKTIIFSHVPSYTKFHARGMLNFMIDPGRYDYVNFFKIPQTDGLGLLHYLSKGNLQELKEFINTQPLWLILVLLMGLVLNTFLLVLLLYYFFIKSTPFWSKVYLVAIVGYIWFLTGPIGSARFKIPIYPLLAIAAIIGIQNLYTVYKQKSKSSQ